jgi:PAS domain S-box-containing protein
MKKRALQFAIVFLIAGFILTLIIGSVERRALRSYEENVPYVALAETIKNRTMQAQLRLAQIEAGNSLLTIDTDVLPLLTSSETILDGAYGGKSSELGNFVKLDDEKRAILKEAVFSLGKVIAIISDSKNNAALASTPAPVVQAAADSADSLTVEPVIVAVQNNVKPTVSLNATLPAFVQFTATIDKFDTAVREQVSSDQTRLNVYSWLSIFGLGIFFTGMGVMVYRLQGNSDKIVAENAAQIEQQHKSAKSLSTFVDSISAGNFSVNIELDGDQALAATLLSMRDKLRENADNDRKRNWSTTGQAQIGEILRATTQNIDELYDNILKFLVKYTKSNQGGLFLLNEDNEVRKELDLVACYAFERKKFLKKNVTIGEGLVGQCFLEGARIYLVEVPQEYVSITSGLGGANPNALLIVPLKVNESIYGVLELATFGKYDDYEIELVEKLAETIAATISNVRINESTRILLEKTQQQAEEMRAQEEEMRQNMEELEATQEEMRRKEKHIHEMLDSEKRRSEFKDKNRSIILEFSKSEPVMKAQWIPALESLTREVGSHLRVSRVGIWKYDEAVGVVAPERIYSYDRDAFVTGMELSAHKFPVFLNAIRNEKTIVAKDAMTEVETRDLSADYLESFGIHGILIVPYFINGRTGGYISCEHSQPMDWSDDHLEFIKSCAEELTITANSVRMTKMVSDMTEAQAMLQTIIDNLPRAVFWKDKDLRIQGCNKKFANVAGFSSHQDMLGKSDFEMPWKQHAEAYRADDLSVMNTKQARLDQEERNVNSDGVESWVLTSKVPVVNNHGEVIAVLGMFEDITERKRRENDLQAKITELDTLRKLVANQKN